MEVDHSKNNDSSRPSIDEEDLDKSKCIEKDFEFIHNEKDLIKDQPIDDSCSTPVNESEDDDEILYSDKPKSSSKLKPRPSFIKDKIDAHYDKLPWGFAAIGRILGLKFAPISIPLERRIQTFAVFLWMSMFLFMGFGSLYLLVNIFLYTNYWWISLCYFTFYLTDRSIKDRGGRRSNFMRNMTIWKYFANFFPMKIIKTTDYDPANNYIFGYHPHGILSAGALAHFGSEGTNFSKLFPGLTPHPLTLAGHFSLPIYRDILLASGTVSSSKESMRYLLTQEEKGKVLGLVVGGAPESLYCHPGDVYLYLNKRKGFCKYALQFGAHLVPTFSFGENYIYDQIPNAPGTFIRQIQDNMQKFLGFAPCLFLGRGIFQYSFGIIPYRKPINTVFGPPIAVEQVRNPSQKQLDDLHQKYIDAVVALYNDYKDQYAEDPKSKIIIV